MAAIRRFRGKMPSRAPSHLLPLSAVNSEKMTEDNVLVYGIYTEALSSLPLTCE